MARWRHARFSDGLSKAIAALSARAGPGVDADPPARGLNPAAARPWWTPPIALALLTGVLVVQLWPALPPIALSAAALVGGTALYWRLPTLRWLAALLIGVFLAALHGGIALRMVLPAEFEGVDIRVRGVVVGIPAADARAARFDLAPQRATAAGQTVPARGTWRLAWFGPHVAFLPGDQVELVVRARAPRGLSNGGGFDFERYAVERRIAATGYVRALDAHVPAEYPTIDGVRAGISRWIFEERGDGTIASLLRALSVGDQAPIRDPDWLILRATGTTHLIAISGFHIGLVAGFGALLAGGLLRLIPGFGLHWPRRQVQALAALLAAFGYSLLAGMSIPVVRTLIMIAVVLLAVLWRRSLAPWSALALAAAAVLIIDPLAVLNPGFWLSFVGVAWLIFCLGARSREAWFKTFGRAQWISALGLLPLTLWFFQQGSVIGPLANLVAVPWISLISVPLVLIATALKPLAPELAVWVLGLAAQVTAVLWQGLTLMASWPFSQWYLPTPAPMVLVLAVLGAAVLLVPRAVPGRSLGLVLMLPLLWPAGLRPPPGSFDVQVIDVGQGLSVLVTTTQHALLFDTGASRIEGSLAASVVIPVVRGRGVQRLDGLIVSHGDDDHAGGTEDVLSALQPRRVWKGAAGTDFARCEAGERWIWDGVVFEFLHPPRGFPDFGNDSACVLAVGEGAARALIASDIGVPIEELLIAHRPQLLPSALLLVPHHGSAGSSSTAFVRRVRPQVAVFSVGWRNRFGHPRPEIVARYQRVDAQIRLTSTSGALDFRLTPDAGIVRMSAARQSHRRWWHRPDQALATTALETDRR